MKGKAEKEGGMGQPGRGASCAKALKQSWVIDRRGSGGPAKVILVCVTWAGLEGAARPRGSRSHVGRLGLEPS